MTDRPILKINVDDSEFKRFASLFEKYRAAVKDMPGDWKAVNEETGVAATNFQTMVAAMMAQQHLARDIAKAEDDAADAAERARKSRQAAERSGVLHWKDMARSTRDVAGNILSATASLLKWSTLTAAFSGLLGAGGLFGINRMASSVAAGRQSSVGLGVSFGEQKAFDISYGQSIDTHGFLQSVNEGLTDVTKRGMFFGAGMSGNDLQGSTAQVGIRLLEHLKKIADNTNPAALGTIIQARGLNVSVAEMRNLQKMDLGAALNRFNDESKRLDLTQDTQNAWTRFTQQMQDAGQVVENSFAKGLVNLEPSLERLSTGLVHLIEAVSNSPKVKEWLDELVAGLERLVNWLDSKDETKKPGSNVVFQTKAGPLGDITVTKDNRGLWDRLLNSGVPQPAGGGLPADVATRFSANEAVYRLPAGLLSATYGVESSYGTNAGTSSAGALGPMQLMPGTAKAYGVTDPRNLGQSAEGAAHLYADLLKEFHGDLAKAVAAYNWGAGNVEAYTVTGRGMQGQAMPAETTAYLAKIADLLSRQSGQKIVLEVKPATGSDINIQSSQVAQ